MAHNLAASEPVNHELASPMPIQHGDVHEAMARIADIIVEGGEGLTLESLIKAFWRTYSTPEGNIVSIHEGRGSVGDTTLPEDAFARMSGRMDQIAESLGFASGPGGDATPRPAAASAARADGPPAPVASIHQDDQPGRRRADDGANDSDSPRIETSLPDRAQFELALEENYRIARSEVEPLSIAICSVSRIEQIVKQHGLHTATRLMERVASTLSQASRGECYSARKSNSEFIMLARGITITQFTEILEQSIYDLSIRRWHDKFSNKALGMIDMHVGIAHVFDFADPSHAMRAADLAHEQAVLEASSTVVLADPAMLDVA